jgi:hypothetical protein
MIRLAPMLTEAKVKKLSPQEVADKKLFGPVFHGTSEDARKEIEGGGFKIFYGHERSGNVTHGYEASDYWGGIPAPIHHLGFGIYFTTSKTIAKSFNHGTTRGLKVYFLDVPRLETINFGAPRTMMKWWLENGYDYDRSPLTTYGNPQTNLNSIREERYQATLHLTDGLKKKHDAVWFKGKGMYRLLDGDQVCVYDPNNIYEMDIKMAKKGEVGSKVVATIDIDRYNRGTVDIPKGTRGLILKKEDTKDWLTRYPGATWAHNTPFFYTIKWDKGGTMQQILDNWITPL